MNCTGTAAGGDHATGGTPVRGFRAQRGPLIDLSVHELVDDLCKKAASLCTGGKYWGLRRCPAANARLSPARKPFTSCAWRKARICPHAAPQWLINKPKVYQKFISL